MTTYELIEFYYQMIEKHPELLRVIPLSLFLDVNRKQ